MNKVFEKIIEKLEELKKAEIERDDLCDEEGCGDGEEIYEDGKSQGRFEQVVRIIEIVKQEAAEYNNGWIPCSERMPEDEQVVLTSKCKSISILRYSTKTNHWYELSGNWWWCANMVTAWQQLPAP